MGIETFPVLSLIVLSPFVGAILLLIEPQRWYYAISPSILTGESLCVCLL